MGNELNIDAQLQEDWLDAKLREEMPYIDDAGFTARVMQRLPVRRLAPESLRAAILLTAAVLASLLAYYFAAGDLVDSAAFLAAVPLQTLLVAVLSMTMLMMIAGGTLALVKSRDARL